MSSPEIRTDQLTGLPTILAPARADRPFEFKGQRQPQAAPGREAEEAASNDCPFCEGNEDKTPPELWADRPGDGGPDAPGWRVRSVPNLYPALAEPEGGGEQGAEGAAPDPDPLRSSARAGEPDLFAASPASGTHEVIVHSPRHVTSLARARRRASSAPRSRAGASGCAPTPRPPTSS